MRSVNTYQDILTPEEEEEKWRKIWEKQRLNQEHAEALAEIARDQEKYKDSDD
jgi:hypothetical protein